MKRKENMKSDSKIKKKKYSVLLVYIKNHVTSQSNG